MIMEFSICGLIADLDGGVVTVECGDTLVVEGGLQFGVERHQQQHRDAWPQHHKVSIKTLK